MGNNSFEEGNIIYTKFCKVSAFSLAYPRKFSRSVVMATNQIENFNDKIWLVENHSRNISVKVLPRKK